jgi:hypothetical protein
MYTSGKYKFELSRDDLIKAALRLVGAYGIDDVIPQDDMNAVAQALNILCKEFAINGLPLWSVVRYEVPMEVGKATYDLSIITGSPRPLRITDAYIKVGERGSDVGLTITSRYDWDLLGSKGARGVPNQLWYNPQLGAAEFTVYNVPASDDMVLKLVVQMQIQDINLAEENPDFPQEAYRMLKFALADDIGLEYGAPTDIRMEIGAKAKIYTDKYTDSMQEQASIFFQPNTRGM